jgi:hypothetical protein
VNSTSDIEPLPLDLPTAIQLKTFIALRAFLQKHPQIVCESYKRAFLDLLLDLWPNELDARDAELMRQISPEDWRLYCQQYGDYPPTGEDRPPKVWGNN